MSVPQAQMVEQLRRFPLRRLRLPMAGGNLSIVTPDADAYRRQGGGVDGILRGDEPPYWADVWPASVAAARLLSRIDLAGRRVLDLGCGVGVAGAAAARAGAATWFADRDPDALAFAAFNGRSNVARGGAVHTLAFDWARDSLPGGFDLWLLCDVTYRPRHHPPIFRLLQDGLGTGVALHCDPGRPASESFLQHCAENLALHTATTSAFLRGERVPIRVVLMGRDRGALTPWIPLFGSTTGVGRR